MQSISFSMQEIVVTPVLTGSGAYTAGYQVGGIQTLSKPTFDQGRFAMLTSLTILDVDNQKAALTILLFNALPTIASADQQAFSMTGANLKATCVAQIPIVAGDYATVGSSAVATHQYTNMLAQSNDTQGQLYAAVVTSGTPTYTTTSSLVFRWNFAKQF